MSELCNKICDMNLHKFPVLSDESSVVQIIPTQAPRKVIKLSYHGLIAVSVSGL